MTQLEALKILHRTAREGGPSHQELIWQGGHTKDFLAYAKRRDEALEIVANMIARKQKY